MISVKSVSKSYQTKKVLDLISFEVAQENIFGFIGVNGAGKSTFIKALFQFTKLDGGEILVDGQSMSTKPELKRKIGFLPEVFLPPLGLKAGEFLNYSYELVHGHSCKEAYIREILVTIGLKDHANTLIRHFSKGMRQRLGMGQAIIHKPPLLVLDEPFSGLDPIGRYELKTLFKHLNQQGQTIFFSSHNLNEISDLCSHVAILHNGKISETGPTSEVLERTQCKNLEEAFLKIIEYKPGTQS